MKVQRSQKKTWKRWKKREQGTENRKEQKGTENRRRKEKESQKRKKKR